MKKFFSAIGGIIGYLASLSLAVFFALYCSGRVGWFLVLTFVLAPILSALFTFLFQKNIFLTCDFEKPLCAKGETCDIHEIEKDIIARDEQDMNREVSPLRQAEDAVLVDASDMTIEEVVAELIRLYKEK